MTLRRKGMHMGPRMRRGAVAAVTILMAAGTLVPASMGTGRLARAASPVERQAGASAAVAALCPTGTVQTSSAQPFGNLNGPQGVATDGHFNLYIADTGNNRVVEAKTMGGAPAGSGGVCTVASNLASPAAVAVDRQGNVYIVDNLATTVKEVPAGSGSPTTLPTMGLLHPRGVAVDSRGNVYIADTGNNRVVELPLLAGGGFGSQKDVATGLNGPTGVAVGGLDDVYIADTGNNRVVKVPAGGGQQTIVAAGLNAPRGVLAFGADLFGNTDDVYIADTGSDSLLMSTNGTAPTPLTLAGQTLNAPISLALDGAGGLYVVNSGDKQVVDVKLPSSGQLSGGTGPVATPTAGSTTPSTITATATPAAFGGPAIDADDAVQEQIGPGETEALSVVTVPHSLVRVAIITGSGYPRTAVLYVADANGHFPGYLVKGKGVALPTRPPGRRIAYLYRFLARPYRGRGCALLTFTIPTRGALGPVTMPIAVTHPDGRVTHLGGQFGAHFSVVIDPHDRPGSLHPTSPAQLAVIARKACLGQI